MPRTADDDAYLAKIRDYYARWRSLPAYESLRAVLGLASRAGIGKVLKRLRDAGFLERTPDGRWTPTARFFERPLADAPVPAGSPVGATDGGEAHSIDAWLVRQPSRTVLIPVTGDSMIEAGIRPGDRVVVERDAPARPGDVVVAVIKNRGRIEIRRYALSSSIDWLDAKPDWAGLQAVGRVESTRIIGEKTSTECRYFLCSFPERDRFAAIVRGHWGIENQQHWVLDVQFGEDARRARQDHSAENLALIRRMALNVLRHNGPPRDSIRRRKLRAALNDDDRLRLLLGQPSPADA